MEDFAKPFTLTICTPTTTYEVLVSAVPPVGSLLRIMKVGSFKVVQVEFIGRARVSPFNEDEVKHYEPMEPLVRCVLAQPEDDLSEEVRRGADELVGARS